MNAWTNSLRRAFQLTHMAGMARLADTDWAALAPYDRWRMESAGLTADDWALMRAAPRDDFRGQPMLTPDGIYATGDPRAAQVVARYLGMLADESETAIINPDLATRAATTLGGTQAGTLRGELARAVMQFKSFPLAMMSRHWGRMLETPQGLEGAPMLANRLAYAATMMVTLTALGAVAFQTKQMVSGKDPVDMTRGKFWLQAMAQGGGLGFLGDLLLNDPEGSRRGGWEGKLSILGPTASTAGGVLDLVHTNTFQAMAGKETHAGAEAFRLARSNLPLVNLWYAKEALNHAGLHALQENLSPGYLNRMQQRARKDWSQDYYWAPGSGLPQRAPDITAVAGE